jgi:HTH-type transcriptional regulator / antitoxin HigA
MAGSCDAAEVGSTLTCRNNAKRYMQVVAALLMGSIDSQDRARMVAQARLIEAYERTEWPRTAPALPLLLSYLMDQHNLSRADLVPLLGTASRVSEVLTGKRDLSMTMVRRLRKRFNVSADLLISRGRARSRVAA